MTKLEALPGQVVILTDILRGHLDAALQDGQMPAAAIREMRHAQSRANELAALARLAIEERDRRSAACPPNSRGAADILKRQASS